MEKTIELIKKRFRDLNKSIKEVHEESHKLSVIIFFDMLISYLLYGCTHNDYKFLKFYELDFDTRETYITYHRNKRILKKYKVKKSYKFFDDTIAFNDKFNKYTKRTITDTRKLSYKQFEDIVLSTKTITCKTTNNNKSIEYSSIKDYRGAGFQKKYLDDNKLFLILNTIEEDETITRINPFSVNTIRIVSSICNNEQKSLYGIFKLGIMPSNKENPTKKDFISGRIDMKTGIVHTFKDSSNNEVNIHPVSNIDIKEFKIPMFNEMLNVISSAHKEVGDIGLVTWEIVITKEGPLLLDGDYTHDYILFQSKEYRENNKGLMKYFLNII